MAEEYTRFTVSQRVQHLVWFLAFTVLAVTGLALMYPNMGWAQFVVNLVGGMDNRGLLHRIAAVTFIGLGVAHVVYYGVLDKGKKAIMPSRQDLSDLVQDMKYHLFMSGEKPKFGRYSWFEKADYWAGAAGSVIIIVTGAIMWFSFGSSSLNILGFVPLGVYNWARLIHGYEAILAVAVVIVFHLYTAIWKPGTFPLAMQIWTGKMTKEQMEHEHSLELEELGSQ
ncbi:MAG: cytochrome b/b6 domain-containing protein [Candidatus Hydrothermarchaeales archaeon]